MSTPSPSADPKAASVEAERLRALRNLRVLDTQAEQVFNDLTEVAALVCRVPVSLVTLVDADRLWLKANYGLPGVTETPRDIAFCDHTIRTEGVLEIRDMTRDPRFADNPLVTGSPDIRFYAGAPLAPVRRRPGWSAVRHRQKAQRARALAARDDVEAVLGGQQGDGVPPFGPRAHRQRGSVPCPERGVPTRGVLHRPRRNLHLRQPGLGDHHGPYRGRGDRARLGPEPARR